MADLVAGYEALSGIGDLMQRILFFIPESYSFAVFRPLALAAEARGLQIARFVVGCDDQSLSGSDRRLHGICEVQRWAPDIVVSVTHWVPPFFPGIKVMVFHGFGINKRGGPEEQNSHFRIRGYYDLYCTMATDDTQRFVESASRYQNFQVVKTGWPRLDTLKQAQSMKKSASASGKPVLFYASTFTPDLSSAPLAYEVLEKLATAGDWQVVATLHPKTDDDLIARYRLLGEKDGIHFIEPGSELASWMAVSDVALTDSSSIIYELMFMGIPVVTLNTSLPGPHVVDVDSPEKIPGAIEYAAEKPGELREAMLKAVSQVHEFDDGRSSERVLDAVEWFEGEGSAQCARQRRVGLMRYLDAWIKLMRKSR